MLRERCRAKFRSRYVPVKPVAAGRFRPHLQSMRQSEIFRDNADNCLQLAECAEGRPAYNRYSRMAEAWMALANEQDWLDGEIPPVGARIPQTQDA